MKLEIANEKRNHRINQLMESIRLRKQRGSAIKACKEERTKQEI